MSATPLDVAWATYGSALRVHAHQLLLWGYQDSLTHTDPNKRIHSNQEEPDITGLIAEAMQARLDHPDTPEAYNHYCIGDQVPVSRNGELGKHRGKLDLTVIRSGHKPRISYIFEAKRLRTGDHSIGDYVGAEGMGDYIDCRYARDYPEAVMVGIFHNRDVTYWHGELRRVLKEDDAKLEKRLGILTHPLAIEILADLPGELETMHRRANQTQIRLLHIFLQCS